ncbi:MAG: CHAT domain-containing protein [Candidatus Aminicenantes bacterium]|nr:MAG: CHAT domain-containing protein [Candidatus Aminicenantes bacterium]
MGTYKKFLLVKLLVFLVISFSLPISKVYDYYSDEKSRVCRLYDSAVKSCEKYRKAGDFYRAIDAFRQAREFAREMGNKKEEADCLVNLGLLYWNISRLNESKKKYEQALRLAQLYKMRNELKECQIILDIYRLYSAGKEYRSKGKYQKSINSFQRAIDLAKKTGNKEHEERCLRSLSVTYWELKDFKMYLSMNEKALVIAQYLNNKKEEGKCLYNIGLFYQQLENYSKALNCYEEALIIAKSLGNKQSQSACLNNIGNIYLDIGDYDKSLPLLMEALAIDKQLGIDVHIELNNIGETFRKKGISTGKKEAFYNALIYLEDSLELTKKAGDKETEIYVLNNIGMVHLDLKRYDDALDYFHEGHERAEELQDIYMKGMLLNNIGIVKFNQGNFKISKMFFQQAINIALEIKGNQILWEAFFGLGQCYEKGNEFSQAITCYKKSVNIIDYMRSHIFLDANKTVFIRNKFKVYEHLINLLHRLSINDSSHDYFKEIFYVVERAKARALLESIGESRVDLENKISPKLKKIEREISKRITSIIYDLCRLDHHEEKRRELLCGLQKEEDEYLRLISRIRAEIPEVASLVSPRPSRVEQAQKLLAENTALIEYFLGDNQSFMFFITARGYSLYKLPSRHELEKSLKAYLKILSTPPERKFLGILAAKRIYEELLFPIEENSGYIENLIIIPDGILYYLPFETLIQHTPNPSSERNFLIKKYKISYAPSSSVLLYMSKNRPYYESPKDLLAFGNPSYTIKSPSSKKRRKADVETLSELYLDQGFDFSPLPYSKKEISEISNYFNEEKRDVYIKDEAREEIFKRVPLKDYKIIHFACHGFLSEEFPFRSALVLSLDEDPQEDGFLQVREIYNHRLKANLIVLSACQTGRGKLEKGEGVLGLPRVFFYAGAKSVVLSLWKINDTSTAEFMNHFYCSLSRGNDVAQALRLAKLKMINSKYRHPFYWAAFVINGDSNSSIDIE